MKENQDTSFLKGFKPCYKWMTFNTGQDRLADYSVITEF